MADSSAKKPFQVAVIGGGVCGLVCTVALQKAGVPVQLFESAAAFGEIGAGIGVGPNAVRVLQALGMLDAILDRVNPRELKDRSFRFFFGHGDHEYIFTYAANPEDRAIALHRAVFLEAIVSLLDPGIAQFNKRCTSITESPSDSKRLLVHFQDGTTFETDLVLGADGIKSNVRDYVVGDTDKRLAFSNTLAYRGLIPYAKLKAAGFKLDLSDHPACLCGPGKHFILFAIKDAEIINVVAFSARYDIPIGADNLPKGTPWVQQVSKHAMDEEYEGWGPDVVALLKCMPEHPSKWFIHVVNPPIESYAKGKVAVLGDAAHGMLPHLGAGAGQGLEDAYVLSRLLSHPDATVNNLEAILGAYSTIRQPRAQMVWEASRNAGRTYDFQGPHGPTAEGICEDLRDMYDRVWHHDIEGDIERAIASLREKSAFPTSV